VTFRWSLAGGPGSAVFAGGDSLTPAVSFTSVGIYTLRLRADDGALSSADAVTITVEPENGAPVVDAGADQRVAIALGAGLSGSVFDDGRPTGGTLTSIFTKG
jgi:hypothetical protein